MRKKLSTLALLFLVAAGSVHAYDFSAVTSSGHTLYYNIVSGGAEVTYPHQYNSNYWYGTTKPTGALVIDSTVNHGGTTYSVTSIAYQAFSGCTGLTSVTIPNSVTSIGSYAFYDCTGLTSVSIPNSVTSIGNSAFGGCTGLTSVTIPNSVTSIGERAFYNCTGLTSLVFNATNCTYAGGINSVSDRAFYGCPISSVTIGNSVHNIPDYLLYNCTGLTSVTIPNSVTSIGEGAFAGCTDLTSVTIPNSVTSIGNYAFAGCTGLTSVTIPNSVTSIGERAFYNCTGLTSVTIGDSVASIGNSAFYNCTGLTSVHYTGSVVDWCGITFSNEYSNPLSYAHHLWINNVEVTSVVIPGSIAEIKPYLFYGCYRLTSVTLEEGIVDIGNRAFKDCGIIGELVIPQSVTTIGSDGFRNCYGINEITCLGRVAPALGDSAYYGIDTSITVNIPCGTTNLYEGRWSYFHNFNEIPFLFKVATDNPAQGTAQIVQEPSCDDPVAIVQATARNGYHFDHWSDGSTQNPYTCVVTGSMTLTAFFASDSGQTGIETADGEADGPNVYADGGRIVVTGADGEEVCLYDMMGRQLAIRQEDHDPVIIDVPAAGTYLIRIGTHPARRVVIIR